MNTQDIRKLTAILHADVEGYSRLMGEDESFTVRTLTEYRRKFSDCVDLYAGRVVNTPGDAILAEFPSVVDAVSCAVEIQEQLKTANSRLPAGKAMRFRIGINLGDVILKGEDIFGDGVNIAARVETLAEGGGICITRPVFNQVKRTLKHVGYENIGEHVVKNIVEPVQVYRILMGADDVGKVLGEGVPAPQFSSQTRQLCIAVLPFENISDNRADDYFCRGFVEDLITDLSHFSTLQIISSYSAQKIGAETRDELKIAKALSINYLLKGNLRRQSGHIRITVQLLDTDIGRIVWAQNYDAPMETIFDIQDNIVGQVAGTISTQIDKTLLAAARKKPLTSLAAYDCWLRGMDLLRQGTPAADREARQIFQKALEIDPAYSRAYAGMSLAYFNDWSCQLWERWEETAQNAYHYATEANRLDDSDHIVQMILGRILLYRRDFDQAEQHLDKSLQLNANDADSLAQMATSKSFLGRADEGEKLFVKAMRLNPYRKIWYHPYGAFVFFAQGKYDVSIEMAIKGPLTDVWIDLPAFISAAHAHLGAMEPAQHYLKIFSDAFQKKITAGRRPKPGEVVAWLKTANPFRHDDDIQRLIKGLAKAGLTDTEI